jgi:uncharacterized protein YacL
MENSSTDKYRFLTSFSTFIPSLAIAVYVIGFVVINSFLSQFNFQDSSILSINYVKAGILFLALLIPLLVDLVPIFWTTS